MTKIHVAILDDHRSIVDGYLFRLQNQPDIEVTGIAVYGDDLERLISYPPANVLLLDINVPTSAQNQTPYPIFHTLPRLIEKHPQLAVLVISMANESYLIQGIMETGANGYILKDDSASIQELATIVRSVAAGGIYLSQAASQQLKRRQKADAEVLLTLRQREMLSLCCTYPDISTGELATQLALKPSTIRNTLSDAYLRLNVRSRSGAVAKARELGLITSHPLGVKNI